MAKPTSILIKMVSSADTGFYYVTKKNPRTKTEKLELKKYDPVARKHVVFKESKIKKPSRHGCSRSRPSGRLFRGLGSPAIEQPEGNHHGRSAVARRLEGPRRLDQLPQPGLHR